MNPIGIAVAFGLAASGLISLTAILFALWDIRAELRKLNAKR